MDWLWIFIVFFVLVVLIVLEYSEHDRLVRRDLAREDLTKRDLLSGNPSREHALSAEQLCSAMRETLVLNSDFVIWRQALITAIGASILIALFLYSRFPTPYELFFVGLLIFLGVYFSLSWMRTHFHMPNVAQIEKGLNSLEELI